MTIVFGKQVWFFHKPTADDAAFLAQMQEWCDMHLKRIKEQGDEPCQK